MLYITYLSAVAVGMLIGITIMDIKNTPSLFKSKKPQCAHSWELTDEHCLGFNPPECIRTWTCEHCHATKVYKVFDFPTMNTYTSEGEKL